MMCGKRSLRPWAWLLLVLLLLAGRTAWGDEPQTVTIVQLLQQANERLTTLESRLSERKSDIAKLQGDLTTLSAQLTEARKLLDESQTDLQETRTLLDSLTARYDKLLSDYNAQTRRTRIKLWLWRGGCALGIATTILALCK